MSIDAAAMAAMYKSGGRQRLFKQVGREKVRFQTEQVRLSD
jgi:hypothetical protein